MNARLRWLLTLALALTPQLATAQNTSPLRGDVVEEGSNRPLNNMQVQIAGTSRLQITNERGEFLFAGMQPGTYEVRATGLGYAQGTVSATVTAGQPATVRITLSPSALPLDALLVSAVTGQVERKRELGNSVGRISSEQIQVAATSTVSQVLQARRRACRSARPAARSAPTSGRVRGPTDPLNNDPLLIVDGCTPTRPRLAWTRSIPTRCTSEAWRRRAGTI
jgi:hypothetical protein